MNEAQIETCRRWTGALRSGDYQQGDRALHRGDLFCCLGVLLDLEDPDGWEPVVEDFTAGRWRHRLGDPTRGVGPTRTFMPEPAWFHEHTGLSTLGYSGGQLHVLSSRNDAGDSFERIADLIDEMVALSS